MYFIGASVADNVSAALHTNDKPRIRDTSAHKSHYAFSSSTAAGHFSHTQPCCLNIQNIQQNPSLPILQEMHPQTHV